MRRKLGTLIVLTVVTGAILGGIFGEDGGTAAPLEEESKSLLRSFSQVFATVQAKYPVEVSSEELIESSINGMLRTLDPHSSFFSVDDYDRLQEEQKGKYYGLGITIRPESPGSGRVVIVEPPAPGTPAYEAGLRAGDVIAEIEGKPIDDWDLNSEVIPNLKGPKDTTVDITVERPGEDEPLPFTVRRDEIPLYTIKYAFRIRPQIGYIRISRFAETTSRELDRALESIGEENLEGLILDLRDNPGGALSQALKVSERFLDSGDEIVSTRSRSGRENRNYKAEHDRDYTYPMVVLINQNSASASEIVSGALQDHDRALILGQNSFGKALVQTIFPLDRGKRGLALTTGKYYTPSNRLIQRDYSESFWDYYNNRDEEQSLSSRERFYTDGGRVVYGGGGIMPDEEIDLRSIPRAVRKVQRKNLFREYASRLYSGDIESELTSQFPTEVDSSDANAVKELVESVSIEPAELERFVEFVREEGVELSEEDVAENADTFRNLLKQQLFLLEVGDEASYQIALELDEQVQKAIDRLPQVHTLLQESMASGELAQP